MQISIKEVTATLLDKYTAQPGDTVYDERNNSVYILVRLRDKLLSGDEWVDLGSGRLAGDTTGRRFPKVSAVLNVTREK
ncbi:hypothetical protein PhiM1_13 [Pectobacterium phage PhiM1]|uniref:Uncharacterized protein n=1 Tax=Pectobacterium phage PhiM1 TaxID=1211386 RepID=A0A1P7WFU9_9CAUD|nr:hypothetical protein FDG64_gp13 [Pectobacterium phage PhiM1]AFQ22498.1 hypothetical protein PhiM1_13 [Pectobacterium phage PhiM1]